MDIDVVIIQYSDVFLVVSGIKVVCIATIQSLGSLGKAPRKKSGQNSTPIPVMPHLDCWYFLIQVVVACLSDNLFVFEELISSFVDSPDSNFGKECCYINMAR